LDNAFFGYKFNSKPSQAVFKVVKIHICVIGASNIFFYYLFGDFIL
jgi:hypothetical protein